MIRTAAVAVEDARLPAQGQNWSKNAKCVDALAPAVTSHSLTARQFVDIRPDRPRPYKQDIHHRAATAGACPTATGARPGRTPPTGRTRSRSKLDRLLRAKPRSQVSLRVRRDARVEGRRAGASPVVPASWPSRQAVALPTATRTAPAPGAASNPQPCAARSRSSVEPSASGPSTCRQAPRACVRPPHGLSISGPHVAATPLANA